MAREPYGSTAAAPAALLSHTTHIASSLNANEHLDVPPHGVQVKP